MGWALLGLKLVPMIIQAVTSTEEKSVKKGQDKQEEALQLLRQLLVISQGTTASARDSDVVAGADVETRHLIDALVRFQNATTVSAAETPPPQT